MFQQQTESRDHLVSSNSLAVTVLHRKERLKVGFAHIGVSIP